MMSHDAFLKTYPWVKQRMTENILKFNCIRNPWVNKNRAKQIDYLPKAKFRFYLTQKDACNLLLSKTRSQNRTTTVTHTLVYLDIYVFLNVVLDFES